MRSRLHRPKPRGRPVPKTTRRAKAHRSSVRSRIEPVLAQRTARVGLAIRTIGLARAGGHHARDMSCDRTRRQGLDGRAAPP